MYQDKRSQSRWLQLAIGCPPVNCPAWSPFQTLSLACHYSVCLELLSQVSNLQQHGPTHTGLSTSSRRRRDTNFIFISLRYSPQLTLLEALCFHLVVAALVVAVFFRLKARNLSTTYGPKDAEGATWCKKNPPFSAYYLKHRIPYRCITKEVDSHLGLKPQFETMQSTISQSYQT